SMSDPRGTTHVLEEHELLCHYDVYNLFLSDKETSESVTPKYGTEDLMSEYDLADTIWPPPAIAWGAKVCPSFKKRVIKIAAQLWTDPSFLMACMAFESSWTFSPSVQNSQSHATGLIQFMPAIAADLGTSIDRLRSMTAERQLDYVHKYFVYKMKLQHISKGSLRTVEDVYMMIFCPAATGQPATFVLYASPSPQYQQNMGLDADGDGKITKAEAGAAVNASLARGLGPGFVG